MTLQTHREMSDRVQDHRCTQLIHQLNRLGYTVGFQTYPQDGYFYVILHITEGGFGGFVVSTDDRNMTIYRPEDALRRLLDGAEEHKAERRNHWNPMTP